MKGEMIPEPLRTIMKDWFDPEFLGPNWGPVLLANLRVRPGLAEQFREQFAALIAREDLDPGTYRTLTRHVLPDKEHVNDHLREVWRSIYGDEPIPGDPHRYDEEE